MSCDVRLQARNGFYWAIGFLLVVYAVVITRLPAFDWGIVIPALVLGNLAMATFYFIGGLVLLEKGEGTLEALVVTPLRPWEYLTSKVATLIGLSLVENVAIVALACGRSFRPLPLVLGIVLASAIYCLIGFISVARYDSINEFLFPSMLVVAALSLPILHYAGLWTTPLMYLHPLQAPLVILEGATREIATWQWVYGVVFALASIGLLGRSSVRSFRRFVVERPGAR
jgi:fluoroquinolone transport system permease protein